jgi:phosphoglycerate dehydrogenase-like enzyme
MRALLISHRLHVERGADLASRAAAQKIPLRVVSLPEDPGARLSADDSAQLELAFFSEDLFPTYSRQFFSAVRKAPKLEWLHVFNVGVDHPIYTEMLERGVRLTTSAGSTAGPIAQTAITGVLMLARNFPRWLAAQRKHEWNPARLKDAPADLRGQTMVILGVGAIGSEIARLAQALGLHVVGIRRSPRAPDDPVQELYPPAALAEVLPRAQWLVIACPLTAQTRGVIDADALARLPRGARVINIARGEIVDERALVSALQSGHVGGAYLDVFHEEPLPAASPLWDLPNVIVTPHNSATAAGNGRRVYEIFCDNLARLHRGSPLAHEVRLKEAHA